MEALRPAEETLVDYGKYEEINTMAHDGGTSLECLMYCTILLLVAMETRETRERERERVGWQKDEGSVKVVVLYAKLTTSYST